MNILLVEDDKEIADFIIENLKENNHRVDYAEDGEEGLSLAVANIYNVIVMDRMLPKMQGLDVIKEMREQNNNTPVLILSALNNVDDRIKGIKEGGDDYLTKPFAFAELLARVEALYKRDQTDFGKTIIKIDGIEINLRTQVVKINDEKIELLRREYTLLEYFLTNPNQVVTRTMLLQKVWGYNFDPQTNIIDVHISRLRKKIEEYTERDIISTVRGAGYILKTLNYD